MAEPANFDGDAVGSPPGGWAATMTGVGLPKWIVENDDTALSKSTVLKQSGNDSTFAGAGMIGLWDEGRCKRFR